MSEFLDIRYSQNSVITSNKKKYLVTYKNDRFKIFFFTSEVTKHLFSTNWENQSFITTVGYKNKTND